MTAYEPPAEAVEAVAKIIDPSAWGDNWWGFRAPGDTRTAEELREADRERARLDARAVLTAAGPIIAAQALREAAQDARLCWTGTTNLRDQDDPERFYSFDAWLDVRAARIEKEVDRG